MFSLYSLCNLEASYLKFYYAFFISLLGCFVANAQPVISSFTPESGPIGTTVTIHGLNFSSKASNNTVYFGAVKATILSASNSTLKVSVPTGATYEPLTVTTGALTAYSSKPFAVTSPELENMPVAYSFAPPIEFSSEGYPNFVTSKDLDGDGKPELIALNNTANTISLFKNMGGLGIVNFTSAENYTVGSSPFGAAVGDLNGDGKPDVVIGDYENNNIIVYKNASTEGSLSLVEKKEYPSGQNPISIGIADFDSDGKPDIAAVNNNSYTVSIFRNTSTVDSIKFAAKIDYFVGVWVRSLTICDFDKDGKSDVAVANTNDNTLSILKNMSSPGTVAFSSRIDLETGASPFYISSADLDEDGKVDIIVANSASNNISIYKNTSSVGSISFANKIDISTGQSPVFCTASDIDGDGKPDIAVVNFGANSISLFKNQSTINVFSFDSPVQLPTAMSPRYLSIGDINGDGQPDISFVNSNSNTLSVVENTMRNVPLITGFTPASGSTDSVITITGKRFSHTTGVVVGGLPVTSFIASDSLITATIGSGGTGDIVVNTTEGAAVMPGFTFITPTPVIKSFTPASGSVGTSVTIKGTGLKSISQNATVYFGAVKASITASTDSTLVVIVPKGATYSPITVTVNALTAYAASPFKVSFPGSGNGFKNSSFVTKTDFATGSSPRSIAVADFDNDGKADLFVTNQALATASIFKNTSTIKTISLEKKPDLEMELEPFDVATGDFDSDGKIDIAVSNANGGSAGSLSVRRNTSEGGRLSFSDNTIMAVGNGPRGLSVGDLNADGKPDIVVTSGNSGLIAVFKNTSDSVSHISFASQTNISALQHADDIVLADLDGDRKPELISANFTGGSISVWKNTSSRSVISFAPAINYAAGNYPVSIAAGDLDGDNKIDIVVANYGSNTLSVFRNTSNGGAISLAAKQDLNTGKYPRAIALGDLDGDSNTDLLVSYDAPSEVAVFRNLSSSEGMSFATAVAYPSGVEPVAISVADIDGDSKPEIIMPNDYSSIAIFHNRIDEPIISSFTPNAAKKDSVVIIRGENLAKTGSVNLGGTPASSFTVVADSVLQATIGTGSTGVVEVTTPFGTDTLRGFIFIPPLPLIKSFSPISGTVGTEVKIIGDNLGKITSVRFGNTLATSFRINSDTSITAVVGKGGTGDIMVFDMNGSSTLGQFIFLIPTPIITSFSPSAGAAGTKVHIKGKNFTWTSAVSFGDFNASSFVVNTDSTITAVVGDGGSGAVGITSEFGEDTLSTFIFLLPNELVAYPNPAKDYVTIAHPGTDVSSEIKLVDLNGRVIKRLSVAKNEVQTTIYLASYPPGIYQIVWTDGRSTISQAVLIQ